MPTKTTFKLAVFVNSNVAPGTPATNGPGTAYNAPSPLVTVYRACGYQWLFGSAAAMQVWGSPDLYIDPMVWDPESIEIEIWDSNPNWKAPSNNLALSQFSFILSDTSPFTGYVLGYSGTTTLHFPAKANYPPMDPTGYMVTVTYGAQTPAPAPTAGTLTFGNVSQAFAVWPVAALKFIGKLTAVPRIKLATSMAITYTPSAGAAQTVVITSDPDMIIDTP